MFNFNFNIEDENEYGLDQEDYEEAAFQEWWRDRDEYQE